MSNRWNDFQRVLKVINSGANWKSTYDTYQAYIANIRLTYKCLQCFDTVGWVSGGATGLSKIEWWGAGVVIWLEQGANCMWSSWCHCHPISFYFIGLRIDLTFPVLAYPGWPAKEAVKRVSVVHSKLSFSALTFWLGPPACYRPLPQKNQKVCF